jgi:hypothetical protein
MPIKALVVGLRLLRKECCGASVLEVMGVADATRYAGKTSDVFG